MFPLDRIRHATHAARPAWRRILVRPTSEGDATAAVPADGEIDTPDTKPPRHSNWDEYYASEQADETL